MCGRFSLTTPANLLAGYFELDNIIEFDPHYNIAPSQNVFVVRNTADQHRESVMLRWGLVPFWTKPDNITAKLINARSETAHEKPSFRNAFKKKRCLIAASGFYEWQKQNQGNKQPYFIHLPNDEPLAMAGLWEHWQHEDQIIESCTILTKDANDALSPIHHRMPVVLRPEQFDTWLDREQHDLTTLHRLIDDANGNMVSYKVSTAVNNPVNDSPECIQEIG